jgi:hypothetical protein
MPLMVLPNPAENQDIIEVNHYKATQMRMEQIVMKTLESSKIVSEAKGRHHPLK